MKSYLHSCIESMDKPILKDFRKLGKIFYHKYWKSKNSRSVSTSELVWLWKKVVLVLSFIDDCPRSIRFIEQSKFLADMRNFLRFCYDLLQSLPYDVDEKLYTFYSPISNFVEIHYLRSESIDSAISKSLGTIPLRYPCPSIHPLSD